MCVAGLRDNGYVQSDGAEGDLGVMLLAFTKNKTLVENYDMEYTGFFLVDSTHNKIIASNVEIKNEISIENLKEALRIIEEAATKYYSPDPDRLDLLATSIIWGMAPPS